MHIREHKISLVDRKKGFNPKGSTRQAEKRRLHGKSKASSGLGSLSAFYSRVAPFHVVDTSIMSPEDYAFLSLNPPEMFFEPKKVKFEKVKASPNTGEGINEKYGKKWGTL